LKWVGVGEPRMIRFVSLKRDDPESWALMPSVLARVGVFCVKYGTDTTAKVLLDAIMLHFASPETTDKETGRATAPMILAMAAVSEGEVVGHLVLSVDYWCGSYLATIVQYETDVPIPR